MPTALEYAQPETVGVSSRRLQRIDDTMQRYIESGEVAGILTLVARRGKIIHQGCYGYQDRSAGTPLQPGTLFRIYSMTKAITCTAVMLLYEEGAFQLTDPISHFIPCFQQIRVAKISNGTITDTVPLQRPLTIYDLLTHTSGLAYGLETNNPVDLLYRQERILCMEEVLSHKMERIAQIPLLHQPAERFTYSISIDVLSRMIEVISGKAFDTFLQERIFDPLGMTETGFFISPQNANRLSSIYTRTPDGNLLDITSLATADSGIFPGGAWIDKLQQPQFLSGGGGLVSTINDYYKFVSMLASHGKFGKEMLLSRKTVQWMTMPHLSAEFLGTPGAGLGFGIGILTNPVAIKLPASIGSFWGGGAAGTEFFVDPKEQLSGLVMLQLIPAGTVPVGQTLLTLACQAIED